MENDIKWRVLAAIAVATGTGISVVSNINFNGADYIQHPTALVTGALIPAIVVAIAAYYISPVAIRRIRAGIAASLQVASEDARGVLAPRPPRKGKQTVVLLLASCAIAGLITMPKIPFTAPTRHVASSDGHISLFDPDRVGDNYTKPDRSTDAEINGEHARDEVTSCLKTAAARYASTLLRLGSDPLGAATDLGKSEIEGRRALETMCVSAASCQFTKDDGLKYTRAFSNCISSAEKDMLSE